MPDTSSNDPNITRLVAWAEAQPLVRAMLMTSTRAVPGAVVDVFADYDIILVLRDVRPFHQERSWLKAFGEVLALYHDPLKIERGFPQSGYVIQFEEGLKIDFSLWTVEYFRSLAADPQLMDELDAGYQVLLDKESLTVGLKPPTYLAYIPHPPSLAEYLDTIENFYVEATYITKYLWRGDLVAAKYLLDGEMKQEQLIPMLTWHYETEHNWSVKPGPLGRRLQKYLRPDLLAALERTYACANPEDNWQALLHSLALMRKAAVEVGERLGYAFPHDQERRVLDYLHKVHGTPHENS